MPNHAVTMSKRELRWRRATLAIYEVELVLIGRTRVGWYQGQWWKRRSLSERVDITRNLIDGLDKATWLTRYEQWHKAYSQASWWGRFWMDPLGWRQQAYERIKAYDSVNREVLQIKQALPTVDQPTWDEHCYLLYFKVSSVLKKPTQSLRQLKNILRRLTKTLKKREVWKLMEEPSQIENSFLEQLKRQFQRELLKASQDFLGDFRRIENFDALKMETHQRQWEQQLIPVRQRWLKKVPRGVQKTLKAWQDIIDGEYEGWNKHFIIFIRRAHFLREIGEWQQRHLKQCQTISDLKKVWAAALRDLRGAYLLALPSDFGALTLRLLSDVSQEYYSLQAQLCKTYRQYAKRLGNERISMERIKQADCPEQKTVNSLSQLLLSSNEAYAWAEIKALLQLWKDLEQESLPCHISQARSIHDSFIRTQQIIRQLLNHAKGTSLRSKEERQKQIEELEKQIEDLEKQIVPYLEQLILWEERFLAFNQQCRHAVAQLKSFFPIYQEDVMSLQDKELSSLQKTVASMEAEMGSSDLLSQELCNTLKSLFESTQTKLVKEAREKQQGTWTQDRVCQDWADVSASTMPLIVLNEQTAAATCSLVPVSRNDVLVPIQSLTLGEVTEEVTVEAEAGYEARLKAQLAKDQVRLRHFFYAADVALKRRFAHTEGRYRLKHGQVKNPTRFVPEDWKAFYEAQEACLKQYRQLWRKMALRYHPDKNPSINPQHLDELFKVFNEAKTWTQQRLERVNLSSLFYETLQTPVAVGWYDRVLWEDQRAERLNTEIARADEAEARANEAQLGAAKAEDGLAAIEEALAEQEDDLATALFKKGAIAESQAATTRANEARQRAAEAKERAEGCRASVHAPNTQETADAASTRVRQARAAADARIAAFAAYQEKLDEFRAKFSDKEEPIVATKTNDTTSADALTAYPALFSKNPYNPNNSKGKEDEPRDKNEQASGVYR